MSNWRAIFCKSQKENIALTGIEALSVPTFFPYRLVRRWMPGGQSRKIKIAYFPRYLFADLDGIAHVSVKVSGVETILGDVGIPEAEMTRLRALVDDDGRVKEPEIKPGDVFPVFVGGSRLAAEFVAESHRQVKAIVPLFGAQRQVIVSNLYLVSCPA